MFRNQYLLTYAATSLPGITGRQRGGCLQRLHRNRSGYIEKLDLFHQRLVDAVIGFDARENELEDIVEGAGRAFSFQWSHHPLCHSFENSPLPHASTAESIKPRGNDYAAKHRGNEITRPFPWFFIQTGWISGMRKTVALFLSGCVVSTTAGLATAALAGPNITVDVGTAVSAPWAGFQRKCLPFPAVSPHSAAAGVLNPPAKNRAVRRAQLRPA